MSKLVVKFRKQYKLEQKDYISQKNRKSAMRSLRNDREVIHMIPQENDYLMKIWTIVTPTDI